MRLTRRLPAIGILGLSILSIAVAGLAQVGATTADLSGVVVDQLGAVVPGVAVTASHHATRLERSAVTGVDGRYAMPALPPGVYSVTAALAGFATRRAENIRLALGEAMVLDFELEIAERLEEVTVVGEPVVGVMRQGSIATVVSEREIESLPTNGRNFIAFSLITPGVNADRTQQQGPSASSGLTFAGQRGRSNNITVDGLDNNDFVAGGVRATFSQDAVQEFQVLASSYSAEFGNAAGGVVNIVTRSGTNTLSGSLFIFSRHDALNAKEHFERFTPAGESIEDRKAPFRQRQFGGTLGGPLRRNRAFFFLSAERLRVRANNFVNIDDATAEVLRRAGFPVDVGHVPYRYEADQVLAKADTHLNAKHQLSMRFNWSDLLDENSEPWGGQVARSRGGSLNSRDLMGAAALTSVLSSSSTVNELRFQVANRDQRLMSLDPTCSGVCEEIGEGGPGVDVGSIQAGRHRFTPQPRENRRYQVVETYTRDIRRHQLKVGGDVSWVHQPSLAWPFSFGGHYGFQTVEALTAGRPLVYVQGYGNPSANDKWFGYVSLYAQDDWRVSERLTLRLGVRYQNQAFPQITESVPGLAPYGWPADNNNVAPRLGVSWTPSAGGGTSFSGSYGIFHDHHPGVIWGGPFALSGTADHSRTLTAFGPNAAAAWNAPGRRLPEPPTYASQVITIDPGLKTPSAHHLSARLERVFREEITAAAHAVYVRGFDQVAQLEYNPLVKGVRPLDVDGVRGTSASVMQLTSWADSWYRGLIVSLQKRRGARYRFLAVYTLSKAEDMATDYSFSQPQENGFGRNPADPAGLPLGFDPDSERGPSLQDQRHRFVLSGDYRLPGRVTVSGILTVGSGRPYNITAGRDLNEDGAAGNDRPWRQKNELTTRIGRNAGLLPGTSTVDLRVATRLVAGDRALDLIGEVFNLFNHTNYTAVDAVFGDGAYPNEPRETFGRFTKAGPPFQAQLAMKFSF